MRLPSHIISKLNERIENNSFRTLNILEGVDFYSNDYLGHAQSNEIYHKTNEFVEQLVVKNGATGSRLISGQSYLVEETEDYLAEFYKSDAALLFNSGYVANIGVLTTIPKRNDVIFYDELVHASIREGLRLSHAKSQKFKHNDYDDLENKLKHAEETKYIVVESVYSMDGDQCDLEKILQLCEKYNAYLIIDEAHGVGVVGKEKKGLSYEVNHPHIIAKIVTFGKAMGCHGAAVLGNQELKKYLVNFCKAFIYTTGLSPHSVATILSSHQLFSSLKTSLLERNISYFKEIVNKNNLQHLFISCDTAIQSLMVGGNDKTRFFAKKLQQAGYIVKPILSPTVPEGTERIRICLHSYNSEDEIKLLISHILEYLN